MDPEPGVERTAHSCRRCCSSATTPCEVLALRASSAGGEAASAALATFVAQSWPQVHAVARRLGSRTSDPEDLTQAYFVRFLEKGYLRQLRSWQGCLRPFLLTSARHFLSNARDHERAAKRGGAVRTVSLEGCCGAFPGAEPRDHETPETLLARAERQQALGRALRSVAVELRGSVGGRRLTPLLRGLVSGPARSSAQIAREWGTSETAVRVACHRLRRRLARALANELAAGATRADRRAS